MAPTAIPYKSVPSAAKHVVIGQDDETRTDVAVGNMQREGGFYILGQPRTGKSTLLVSMALQDIQNGHGVLFIDPHYDAINNLLARIPNRRLQDVILLDPSDNARSVALNVLHCPDPKNENELDMAAGRVRDIFTKLWADERGELGIWLNKIMTNAVHILLANPREGFTLADLPLLLTDDPTLRNALLKHVKKSTVRHFWDQFNTLTRRDRMEQAGPAISRLDILLADSRVRDIVGQSRSTIDFADILKTGKIVLLRRASNIDPSIKNLIGTIVLSEFLYAVYERAKLPEKERTYFGIYCDEFQEFATPDFARLFTQTGKLGAMPVVAHQTRQQFRPQDPNYGATAASPTKAFFTLSPIDANEMPLVFAKEPPTESEYEQQLVISDEPVRELLRGRHKPEIQEFVDTYLRHLKWRREDTKEEIEGERLMRLSDLDEAALYGIDERIAYANRYVSNQLGALQRRAGGLASAHERTLKIIALHERSEKLRLTFRGLNTFLIEVMEGKKKRGQEAFSEFLVNLASCILSLTETESKILELYIRVSYGDRTSARVIPFELSRARSLFSRDVALLTGQSEKETKMKRQEFRLNYMRERMEEMRHEKFLRSLKRKEQEENSCKGFGCYDLRSHCFGDSLDIAVIDPRPKRYTEYVWYCCCFRERLASYTSAKIAPSDPMSDKVKELVKEIPGSLRGEREEHEWLRPDICREFKRFLHKYQDGALIILSLINGRFVEIDGCDPVDTWECIATLADVMKRKFYDTEFVNNIFASYFRTSGYFGKKRLDYSYDEFVKKLDKLKLVDPIRDWVSYDYESDCRVPDTVLRKHWEWFSTHCGQAAKCWKGLSEPKRVYLMCRAFFSDWYDLRRFGGKLPASTNPEYEGVVEALRTLISNDRQWREEEEERKAQTEEMESAQAGCRWELSKVVVPPRPYLEPRVLSSGEARAVKRACAKELSAAAHTKAAAATIVDFAAFCDLLAKPENHIRIKGQYVEKQVRKRTEIDMVNEAARLLSSVEPHSAYVRFEKRTGGTGAWTGKVRMEKLVDVGANALARAHEAIKPGLERYTRPRERIRREIEERQNAWRASAVSGLTNVPLPAGKAPSVPAVPSGAKLTQPPPTRTKDRLPGNR